MLVLVIAFAAFFKRIEHEHEHKQEQDCEREPFAIDAPARIIPRDA
jgi:hypothetical protein